MPERLIPDAQERKEALDPTRSFIVQAPAGSGKTTLLAQRFVSLLATVDRPEEILAITFTKKAAAEMRHRVLSLLQTDDSAAQAVRQRADARGWDIINNPNVLKIQTIDSFALEVAGQTPQLETAAGMGIAEQAQPFYEAAAETMLKRLHQRDDAAPLIAEFLAFLDNDARRAVSLLSFMLSRRDQWLTPVRAVAGTNDESVTGNLLQVAVAAIRASVEEDIEALLNADDHAMLARLSGITGTQGWDEQFAVLRKADGGLRKRLTVKEGISDANDKRELNQWLVGLHDRGAADLLASHGQLPAREPTAEQQSRLRLVCLALALAAADLDVLLQRERLLDFTGLLLRAKSALRDDVGPTDIALFLDYRINHLLVDEYQDTSRAQLEFFNLLTEGWLTDGTTTFFAVGDPMQSIYRFRDADVAIFTDGLRRGLDNVPLAPVNLFANFRSAPTLVEWCNAKFSNLFGPPDQQSGQLGAVSYHNATPMVAEQEHAQVFNWRFEETSDETAAVGQHILELLADDPDADIAVLCRARSHVAALMQLLTLQGISVQATDMEKLSDKPVIRDLGSLHRVLLQPSDELAWFALLRSPLFGLNLADLLALRDAGITHIQAIDEDTVVPPQLVRLQSALAWASGRLYEMPLREVLEGLWFRCGGIDAYRDDEQLHADTWFDLIERLHNDAYNPELLEISLTELFADNPANGAASGQNANGQKIQIMTIHKAKGLEFDHVIVPYLDRQTRHDDPQLLMWRAGAEGLLMGVDGDSVHSWLKYEEKQRASNEDKRLLYVACTRARLTLTLSYSTPEGKKPGGLAKWLVDAEMQTPRGTTTQGTTQGTTQASLQTDLFSTQTMLRRLPAQYTWQEPHYIPVPSRPQPARDPDLISQRTEVILGNLVHRGLAWVADTQPEDLSALQHHLPRWAGEMAALPTEAGPLCQKATEHIERTWRDTDGAWVLTGRENAHAELPLTGVVSDEPRNIVVDRLFVDENSVWIIDYKTAEPEETSDTAHFIRAEVARYRPQLLLYRQIVSALYPHQVRLGIYFTAIGHLEKLPVD